MKELRKRQHHGKRRKKIPKSKKKKVTIKTGEIEDQSGSKSKKDAFSAKMGLLSKKIDKKIEHYEHH